MKSNPMEHVKLYAGIRAGSKWQSIVGIKIAGVKIIVPWTNFENYLFPETQWEYYNEDGSAYTGNQPTSQTSSVQEYLTNGVKQVLVTLGFFTGCYLYQRHLVSKRQD